MMANDRKAEMEAVLRKQRAAHHQSRPEPMEMRKDRIKRAMDLLTTHGDDLCKVMSADFGSRSPYQSMITDIAGTVSFGKYCLKRMDHWAKPQKRHVQESNINRDSSSLFAFSRSTGGRSSHGGSSPNCTVKSSLPVISSSLLINRITSGSSGRETAAPLTLVVGLHDNHASSFIRRHCNTARPEAHPGSPPVNTLNFRLSRQTV